MASSFVPTYNKPENPGVWMNFDNTVSIYVVIGPTETFVGAAQTVFAAVREAQTRYPDWPRILYLDIDGHDNGYGSFTEDFVEFQQDFWFSVVAPFLTSFELPLTGGLINPDLQRNDLPDSLAVQGGSPNVGKAKPLR